MVKDGRDLARRAVGDEMVRQDLGPIELSRKAGVDAGTVGDFVAGKRWPQPSTRRKLAEALGWSAESIDRLTRGEDVVRTGDEQNGNHNDNGPRAGGFHVDIPVEALDGLGPAEREEVMTAAKLAALSKSREIRRRQGE